MSRMYGINGFCITGYASFHPGGVTCDVNAAARLIDLTACMYVPAPAGLLEQQ